MSAPTPTFASRLMRSFVLRSLLVVAATSLLLAYAVGWNERREAIGLTADLATRVSAHILREIEERWLPDHPDAAVPSTPQEKALLAHLFRLHQESLRIPRIIWFNARGELMHATFDAPAGSRPEPDALLRRALAGELAVTTRKAGEELDIDVCPAPTPLLEVNVPAPPEIDPRLRGHVLELYVDATPLEARIARARSTTLLWCLLTGGALFVAVLTLVRAAQRGLIAQNLELRRLTAGLDRAVEERTRELVGARRLADVGTLAAGLTHEINNPLAIIASCAEGLIDRLRGRPDAFAVDRADFEEYLAAIVKETGRCQRITGGLLMLARSAPHPREPLDLVEFVDEVVALVRPLAASRRQEIAITHRDGGLVVRVARAEIQQILVNLLQNAFDAGSPGATVEIALRRQGDHARLEVRDRGRGIGAAAGERIFEPFFTTKPPGEGVGLGLSVSRHIAELHGGRLSAQPPAQGLGACFVLELPLDSGAAGAAA